MLKLDYITARGDTMPLANNPLFLLTNIDGQTAAGTSIASAVIGGIDGDTVNNIQAIPRTIIIDLRPRSGVDVEDAKRAILKVVKLKQQCALLWTQNNRTVTITGVVESVEMPRWTKNAVMQISIHCSQPFWEDVDNVIQQISEAINLHYFTDSPADMLYFPADGVVLGAYDTIRTKTFHNNGDVAVGLEINILAHDTVTNPIIYDQNGNYFGLGYESESESGGAGVGPAWVSVPFVMQAGDNVIITTHKGHKTATMNGVSLYDKIKPGSTWLQLEAGDNAFSIDSDDDSITNMSFSLIYKQRYI